MRTRCRRGICITRGEISLACSTGGTTEVLCNAITACEWDAGDENDDPECVGDGMPVILLVNNKCQGSFSDTPLEIANRIGNAEADYTDEEFTNYTTIAEVYASTSIPDETEAS